VQTIGVPEQVPVPVLQTSLVVHEFPSLHDPLVAITKSTNVAASGSVQLPSPLTAFIQTRKPNRPHPAPGVE
jgi:hypothetical protein